MTTNEMWHIAGIGALGGLLVGSFCQRGQAVHLLLKNDEQLAHYQHSKLTVISDKDVFTYNPPAIDIDNLHNESIDYLLCCVKAYDITTLLIRLKHHLSAKSIVILIHNGLGVIDEINAQLPQLRIISGICTIGAYCEKPFTVRAFLDGNIHLGRVSGQFTQQEIKMICSVFQSAPPSFQWEEDISRIMWEKFAINCSVNILTVLLNCKNGALLTHVELLEKMTLEVAEVISAYGVLMSAANLLLQVTHLLNKVADNYSSMYKDVQNNRPTELPYLNEHLIKLAQQKNIATPLNIELLNQFYAKPY